MRRKIATAFAVLVLATGLSACGHSMGERALTGGAMGAGAGALIGAASGGHPGAGALIGGLAGAAVGAATADQDRRGYYDDRRGYDDRRDYRRHRHDHDDYYGRY